jgi:hypothetical protein
MANNSGIHIKPSHEGIFKSAAKRAGMSTQAFAAKEKNSDDPKMRKRATFAQNAKKWNHG